MARGISATDLAAQTGMSRANISRIENGRTNVTITSVRRILRALQADGVTYDAVVDMAQRREIDAEPANNRMQRDFARLEARSISLRSVDLVIPAVLQTREYTRALIERNRDTCFGSIDIEPFLHDRFERHEHVYDRSKRFEMLVASDVLTTMPLVGRAAAFQLGWLAEAANQPNCDIRVINTSDAEHIPSVVLLDPPQYSFEVPHGILLGSDPDIYRRAEATFEYLHNRALDPDQSLELIERLQRDTMAGTDVVDGSNSPSFTAATKVDHSS